MAISHVVTFTATLGSFGGTSAAIDTTGANLIVVSVSWYPGFESTASLSDNKGNVYTALTNRTQNNAAQRFFYKLSPVVGAGHTFTASLSFGSPTIIVHGFSGVSAFDQQSGTTASGTPASVQPGSLTPPAAGALVITGIGGEMPSGLAVDSGLTATTVHWVTSSNMANGTGWKVQSPAAAAINPTWTWTGSTNGVAVAMATFLASEAPPSPARLTQAPTEVLATWPVGARMSQAPLETVQQFAPALVEGRLSQASLEVIYPFGCYTYTGFAPDPCPVDFPIDDDFPVD